VHGEIGEKQEASKTKTKQEACALGEKVRNRPTALQTADCRLQAARFEFRSRPRQTVDTASTSTQHTYQAAHRAPLSHRGASKKNDGPARVFAISISKWGFLVRFWAFQGEPKNTTDHQNVFVKSKAKSQEGYEANWTSSTQ
jgi:hypothetical protein